MFKSSHIYVTITLFNFFQCEIFYIFSEEKAMDIFRHAKIHQGYINPFDEIIAFLLTSLL